MVDSYLSGLKSSLRYDSLGTLNKTLRYLVDFLLLTLILLFDIFKHRYSLNKAFVQENIYEEVCQKLETRFSRLRAGNHLDKCNDFGPQINNTDLKNFKENLSLQIKENGADVPSTI